MIIAPFGYRGFQISQSSPGHFYVYRLYTKEKRGPYSDKAAALEAADAWVTEWVAQAEKAIMEDDI